MRWFNVEDACLYSAGLQRNMLHAASITTATTPVEQRHEAPDARFGAATLQPFSVLRPFYERRTVFRKEDPPKYHRGRRDSA